MLPANVNSCLSLCTGMHSPAYSCKHVHVWHLCCIGQAALLLLFHGASKLAGGWLITLLLPAAGLILFYHSQSHVAAADVGFTGACSLCLCLAAISHGQSSARQQALQQLSNLVGPAALAVALTGNCVSTR
jgi:hypothetical protein